MLIFKNVFIRTTSNLFLRNFERIIGGKRLYLSQSYLCNEEWDKRLKTSLLQNVDIENLFLELDKRFALKKKVSCVDIDVFVNSITSAEQFEEVENILHRFRRTTASVQTLQSTHTAVVRLFLKHDRTEALMRILQDRIAYGIFPDPFCYNILMDYFIEHKKHTDAAKIAVLMMLQEELDNKISRILGLYSCHMYFKGPLDSWNPKTEAAETQQGDDDDDEEVYVRVPFLRNPTFDEHFDLVKPEHLVGKTLYTIGKTLKNPVGKSCQLHGLGLYEKWKEAKALLDDILISNDDSYSLYSDSVSEFGKLIEPIEGEDDMNQIKADLKEKLEQLQSSKKLIVAENLTDKLTKMVSELEQLEVEDIKSQKKVLKEYESLRSKALDIEMEELHRKEFEQYAKRKRREIEEKEDLLFFFENWNKHEMELAEIDEEEKSGGQVKGEVEEYIPPDVKQTKAY